EELEFAPVRLSKRIERRRAKLAGEEPALCTAEVARIVAADGRIAAQAQLLARQQVRVRNMGHPAEDEAGVVRQSHAAIEVEPCVEVIGCRQGLRLIEEEIIVQFGHAPRAVESLSREGG